MGGRGLARLLALATAPPCAGPAAAQVTLAPLVDTRVRYENVEQDGLPRVGDDLVVRVRAGVQATDGRVSAVVEGEGTLAVIDRYYDGLNAQTYRPLVNDPQNIGLYRAQLQYKTPGLTITAGRQRIELDDRRFVGSSNWRVNGQTYDALRGEWGLTDKLKLDATYVRGIRTQWGIDGYGARPQAIGGNTVLSELSWRTPVGTLIGFGYIIDEDSAAVQGFRLEQQNEGVRLIGSRPLGAGFAVAFKATWSRQANWDRNPNRYAATYQQGDATLNLAGAALNGGYERLGASTGAAYTSVQFPIGSNSNYQGWAGKFLTTPPDGVRDLYGGPGYTWKALGPLDSLVLQATAHRFMSDLYDRHDGDELDVIATAKRGRTTMLVRFADYRADQFATNTRRVWLQADWTY